MVKEFVLLRCFLEKCKHKDEKRCELEEEKWAQKTTMTRGAPSGEPKRLVSKKMLSAGGRRKEAKNCPGCF